MKVFRRRQVGHGDPSPIYYVYLLSIRVNGRSLVLYAGKGSGDRVYQHMRNLQSKLKRKRRLDAKERLLLLVNDLGYTVYEEIIASGLTEDAAYNLENETIRKYDLLNRGNVAYPHKLVRTV